MKARDVAKQAFEWIFRRAALRDARAALPAMNARQDAAARQARLLLEVARRMAEPAEALPPGAHAAVLLALYRDAIYWALAARRAGDAEPPSDLRALWEASTPQTFAAAAPDDNEASAALRKTLFDDHSPRSLAVTDDDVARVRPFAEALVQDFDSPRRHIAWVVTQRWLRVALIGAALLLLVVGVRATLLGPNLAQGRPFRLSMDWPGWAACLADKGCNGLMFQTELGDSPWIEIDLGGLKTVRRVEVVNRGNCCADRAVPLVVELSNDRSTWTQVARRDAEFGSWTATFRAKTARYVRLRVARRSVLHLQSIAVR